MKNLLLFLFISFLPNCIHAQNFEFPSAADSAVWTFAQYNGMSQYHGIHKVKMQDDSSMVNGKWYSIIGNDDLVRSENNQVYKLSQDSTEEFLLYDFNLEIGDTFIVQEDIFNNTPFPIIVNQIDSILIGNEYRKVWYMGYNYVTWIDGIGCTNSVTLPNYWGSVSGFEDLFCYQENGNYLLEETISIYNNATYQYDNIGCDGIINNTEELLNSNSIKIFPNPTSNSFQIKGLENEKEISIRIFNTQGQLIRTEYNSSTIQVASLQSGIYILEINSIKTRFRKRFVKN